MLLVKRADGRSGLFYSTLPTSSESGTRIKEMRRREPTDKNSVAHSASSLVLVLVLALALVLVMVLMLVLVLVLELVLALVLVLVLMLVPVLCVQRNVASSVSPLPCVLINILENRSDDTEVATTLCLHLCVLGETWHPLCHHFRSAASGQILLVDIPFSCSALLY